MSKEIIINPLGFREYDARWLYGKDINNIGIENLGRGFGSQIIKHTQKKNLPETVKKCEAYTFPPQ